MNEYTIAWLFALLASGFEAVWLICLKYLDMKRIGNMKWIKFEEPSESFATILPLVGYIVFGLANVVCFSMATKKIPMSIAFAVWLAVALVISAIIDITYFKENYTWVQLGCIVLILLGVVGLKVSTN